MYLCLPQSVGVERIYEVEIGIQNREMSCKLLPLPSYRKTGSTVGDVPFQHAAKSTRPPTNRGRRWGWFLSSNAAESSLEARLKL